MVAPLDVAVVVSGPRQAMMSEVVPTEPLPPFQDLF
jgi:hypothetical protein